MDRATPAAGNEEIELYIRTYYSLLRSSGPIRLRSLEETHVAMNSSLHRGGTSALEIPALVYSALRLPPCFPDIALVAMGQMEEVFERRGYAGVNRSWRPVKAPARRRKLYFEPEKGILAAYITSVSDIDDLIPCMVTYQIEWNKMHDKLVMSGLAETLADLSEENWLEEAAPDAVGTDPSAPLLEEIRQALELTTADLDTLRQVWSSPQFMKNLCKASQKRLDVRVNVLGGGLSDYRRAVQFWWQTVQNNLPPDLTGRPIYFVSSNTHSLVNLLSGFAWNNRESIIDFVLRENPEELADEYERLQQEHPEQFGNFLYYASRLYLAHSRYAQRAQQQMAEQEAMIGAARVTKPRTLDIEAQMLTISQLDPERMDARLGQFTPEEIALLQSSDALIFNIDYPLGMAAYHVFSQVSTAVSGILGVYILGKAATLNGRVGDVMIPNVVYDDHSKNTFLFRNCFTAQDVASYLNYGTVFDNQKSVTVRGTFLQNREFMHVFYEESYTDIEMEAGPYLSAIYENIYPKRYPVNEIVNLFINAPYDIGLLHYASDTPISRRQTLLSKSMSYFGVDATYATTIAVVRRILRQEIARQRREQNASTRSGS